VCDDVLDASTDQSYFEQILEYQCGSTGDDSISRGIGSDDPRWAKFGQETGASIPRRCSFDHRSGLIHIAEPGFERLCLPVCRILVSGSVRYRVLMDPVLVFTQ